MTGTSEPRVRLSIPYEEAEALLAEIEAIGYEADSLLDRLAKNLDVSLMQLDWELE